jgi:hypothetical protein
VQRGLIEAVAERKRASVPKAQKVSLPQFKRGLESIPMGDGMGPLGIAR